MAFSLWRELLSFWLFFKLLFVQLAPWFAFGIVIGSAVSVFAKGEIAAALERLGEGRGGSFAIPIASALGILSPLCMYGTIPIAASLSRKGMRDDWLAAFMTSSVLLNPQLIAYSAALGPRLLFLRSLFSLVCGLCAGLLVRLFFRDTSFFCFDAFAEPEGRDTDPDITLRFAKNIGRNLRATAPGLIIGISLAALFQLYVPAEGFARLFGSKWRLGVIIAASMGIPLYACGGGAIPLLAEWLANGMSEGAALSFMISGPATKITNLGALKIVLGSRHFCFYIAYIMLFAVLAGVLTDLFMS